jgi:hypothetical protein
MNLSNVYIAIVGFESMVVYKMVVSDITNPILYYIVSDMTNPICRLTIWVS